MEEENLYSDDSKTKIYEVTGVEEAKKNLSRICFMKLAYKLSDEQKKIYLEAIKQKLSEKSDDILTEEKVMLVRVILHINFKGFIKELIYSKEPNCFLDVIEACLNIDDTKIKESVVMAILTSCCCSLIKKLLRVNEKDIFPDKETAFLTTLKNMLDKKSANEYEYEMAVEKILRVKSKYLILKLAEDSSYFCNVALNILNDVDINNIKISSNQFEVLRKIKTKHDSKKQPQTRLSQTQGETEITKARKKLKTFSLADLEVSLNGKNKDIYLMAINEILNETKLSDQNTEIPTEESILLVKKILGLKCECLGKKLTKINQDKESIKSVDELSEKTLYGDCKIENRIIQIVEYVLNDELNEFIVQKNDQEKRKYFRLYRIWNSRESKFMIERILNSRINIIGKLLAQNNSNFLKLVKIYIANNSENLVERILNSQYLYLINELVENEPDFLNIIKTHLVNGDENIIKRILKSRYSSMIRILSGIDENGELADEKDVFLEKIKKMLKCSQKNEKKYRVIVEMILNSRCFDLVYILKTMDDRFNAEVTKIAESGKYSSTIKKAKTRQIIKTYDSEKRQLSVQPVQANQQIDHKQQTYHDKQTYRDYNYHDYCCRYDQPEFYQMQSRPSQYEYQINYNPVINYNFYQDYQQPNYDQQMYYDRRVNYNYYDHYYYNQYRFSRMQSRLDQYEHQVNYNQRISDHYTYNELDRLDLPSGKYYESREKELQNLFLAEEEFNDLRKRERREYDNTPSAKRNF